jgi:glycine dehydrogenase subunit 2
MTHTAPDLLWNQSQSGRRAVRLPDSDVPHTPLPEDLLRPAADAGGSDALRLPEVSELDVVRYFTRLSQLNFAIDTNFYPLGSCTMKYNPKVHEELAAEPGFASLHPYTPVAGSQGAMGLMYDLQRALAEIAGFHAVTLQPAAGAQGELTGVLMIRAYHRHRGDGARTKVLVPDSAHGTNPATVAMAGLEVIEIPSDAEGNADLEAIRANVGPDTAGIMITNPNTLGLFEQQIEEISRIVHEAGGLVYGDGANLNAILGVLRPGDVGIDVMHFNLHKTFSTPHGGGGPGAGAVGAAEKLAPFLPGPIVGLSHKAGESAAAGDAGASTSGSSGDSGRYAWYMPEQSIGRLKSFHGNFGMFVRAFAYILAHGRDGLPRVGENAVLNANYLRVALRDSFHVKYDRSCMHEFVAQGDVAEDIHTMDIAKRLLDYGFHAPTVYFPLIVKEALMIEPTETETKQTLDAFVAVMQAIAREAGEEPSLLHDAPHTMPLKRLDEVQAARKPVVTYCPQDG